MKIISIHPGHNSTVAYFEDSECKMILHEEKLNNIKNYVGFPKLALKYITEKFDIKQIDFVTFVANYYLNFCSPLQTSNIVEKSNKNKFLRNIYGWLEYKGIFRNQLKTLRNGLIRKVIAPKVSNEFKKWLSAEYSVNKKNILFSDHHLLHALSPIGFYGIKKETLIFTMDGEGDGYFAKIYIFNPNTGKLKEISSSEFDSSIGNLYSKITEFLGMKPTEHEYKVMGLAAYVTEKKYYEHIVKKLSKIVWLDPKTLRFKSKFNINVAESFLKDNLCFERFDNIAAAIQKFTEDLVCKWTLLAIEKTGIHEIALSGGVFLNVKLNQKISILPQVKKMYIQPSGGDESTVIGAAFKLLDERKEVMDPIESMFLGVQYTNSEVKSFLKEKGYFKKYTISFIKDIEDETAKMLSERKVVARFKGAAEWGPRSLCNRSILGNAKYMETFFEVNDSVKMRDFWMPFAPTILEEWAEKYIKDWKKLKSKVIDSSKYMVLAFEGTDLAILHLRAAMHQKDKTLRPQIVEKGDNPELYKLLKKYEEYTGMGGFLNTSLNIHGYPLCGTLEQAMFTFENSKLNYLTLENWLINKLPCSPATAGTRYSDVTSEKFDSLSPSFPQNAGYSANRNK